jgi:hypothetical protein
MKEKSTILLISFVFLCLLLNINSAIAIDFKEKYKYNDAELPASIKQDGINVSTDQCKSDVCNDLRKKIAILKKNLPVYCDKLNDIEKKVKDDDINSLRKEIKKKRSLLKKSEDEVQSYKIEREMLELENQYIGLLKEKSPEFKKIESQVNVIIDHIYDYEKQLRAETMDEFWKDKDVHTDKIDQFKQKMYSDGQESEDE